MQYQIVASTNIMESKKESGVWNFFVKSSELELQCNKCAIKIITKVEEQVLCQST